MNLTEDIEHLCFDKDGVLIDVHAYWRHTTEIRANFLKKEYKLSSNQNIELIENMGIDTTLGKIKQNGPIGYKPRKSIIDAVRKTLESFSVEISIQQLEQHFLIIDKYQQEKNDFNIKILDGVIDFLNDNTNKYIFTIFTSDREKNARRTLKKFGIYKYFKEVLGGDSVKQSKPNPEGILKLCSNIKIGAKRTAYISDTSSDLEMAQNANLPFKIGVLTGLGNREELAENGNVICENLTELSDYLR